MTLREIRDLLKADVLCGEDRLEEEACCAGGSDLMSDVLAFSLPGLVLLTGLSNNQSIRTANIIEAKAIVYVRGKKPDSEGIEMAKEMNLPILSTKLMMYCACGILYRNGLPGVMGF
jgi:predicted transcriptional regulator